MKRTILGIAFLALGLAATAGAQGQMAKAASPAWSANITAIEACSCPMFCQCYFTTKPSAHAGHEGAAEEHFCKFNNAYKVNKGMYGATKLDGAKFWIYGDLGAEFSDGEMDWAVLTFDKSATKEQRDAIGAIAGHLFPVKWKSFSTGEGTIEWVAAKDEAYALLDGGKSAEVRLSAKGLNRNAGGVPMVLTNLKYWGAPRNDGFVMMPNTIEALRVGDKQYEYKGTNGFMITVDINSKDVAPKAGM
ncbi:MAG: DUF1326 domain-containing protein [Candidatus Eisenbacteria bacterium]